MKLKILTIVIGFTLGIMVVFMFSLLGSCGNEEPRATYISRCPKQPDVKISDEVSPFGYIPSDQEHFFENCINQ